MEVGLKSVFIGVTQEKKVLYTVTPICAGLSARGMFSHVQLVLDMYSSLLGAAPAG